MIRNIYLLANKSFTTSVFSYENKVLSNQIIQKLVLDSTSGFSQWVNTDEKNYLIIDDPKMLEEFTITLVDDDFNPLETQSYWELQILLQH
jgi:hypothetical protein